MQTITIETHCPWCNTQSNVIVPQTGYDHWKSGVLIQDAFPHLSPNDRELLMSGICAKCWNDLFGEE